MFLGHHVVRAKIGSLFPGNSDSVEARTHELLSSSYLVEKSQIAPFHGNNCDCILQSVKGRLSQTLSGDNLVLRYNGLESQIQVLSSFSQAWPNPSRIRKERGMPV